MKQIISVFIVALLVGGCTTTKPVQAPCDWSGSHCWPRININQWNSNLK